MSKVLEDKTIKAIDSDLERIVRKLDQLAELSDDPALDNAIEDIRHEIAEIAALIEDESD